jgi:hypothetical protein
MSLCNLQNFFQQYSATILPTKISNNYEIIVSAKRLTRDNIDIQLDNVEREIQRRVCLYNPGDMQGIEDITYVGHERIYGIGDNYDKSNWATRIVISVKYKPKVTKFIEHKTNNMHV